MKILPAAANDYPGIAAVLTSISPENPWTAEEIEIGDQRRDPRFKFQRWIAVENDQIIGVGYYTQSTWFDHPRKFLVWVGVRPECQHRGIGSRLYDAILQGLEPYHPIALRATASGIFAHSRRFLETRGFREVIRDIRSELDVQAFDLSRYRNCEDRFRSTGITIKTLPELASNPNRNQKIYDLDWELSLSVPGDLAAGIGRRGLEQYIEYAITGPNALPEGFFVAVKGADYIGLSHVLSMDKGVSLYHGLTGVMPPYRGLGIGLALKLRVIAFAQVTGYARIVTDNDSKNILILAINERLGFHPKSEMITFEKQFQPEGESQTQSDLVLT